MADSTLNVLLSFPPHPSNPQWTDADYDKQAKKFQETLSKSQPAHLTAGVKTGEDFLDVSFESPRIP